MLATAADGLPFGLALVHLDLLVVVIVVVVAVVCVRLAPSRNLFALGNHYRMDTSRWRRRRSGDARQGLTVGAGSGQMAGAGGPRALCVCAGAIIDSPGGVGQLDRPTEGASSSI